MIFSITLNPSLDLSGTVRELRFNEKNYIQDEHRSAGGNGINAGIIARRLGSNVVLGGFLGGATGDEVRSLLREKKVRMNFIKIRHQTRTNVTVSLQGSHQQSRFSFPGPQVTKTEFAKIFSLVRRLPKGAMVLIGGSLPPGISPSDVATLVDYCYRREIPCVIDVPGEILKPLVKHRPFLIKPNLSELQAMSGKKITTIAGALPVLKNLHRNIPWVCLSSLEGGALLSGPSGKWFGSIPQIIVRSTVGAGDSMVGAMIHAFQEDETDGEAILRMGLAAAAATLTERGMELGSSKSIRSFQKKIYITPVSSASGG